MGEHSHGLRSVLAPLHADRRILVPLAAVVFFTYAYFIGPPAWNQNSRLALTRALVEQGTTVIDDYHETTGDKAEREGHYYSDKAPGASLLAVPVYAAYYAVRRATGGELPGVDVVPLDPLDAAAGRIPTPSERQPGDRLIYNRAHRVALYLCGLGTTTALALLGLAALYLLALRQLGEDRKRALIVTLSYGLATPAFAYSTVFYGHQLCATFVLLGFAATVLLARGTLRTGMAAAVGASLCLACLCEYPAAVPALIVAVLASVRHGLRSLAWMAIGAAPFVVVLGLYHQVSFGSPLATGYDFVHDETFAAGMRVRYGIGRPSSTVAISILFGSYRGLFYLSPVLLLAVWGLALQLRHGPTVGGGLERGPIAAASAIVLYYVLLNSGYYMWDGGAALGPRHTVPMLPLLALGLAPALRTVPRAYAVLAILSVLQMTLATAAAPEAPRHGNPLWGFALPRLFHGQIANYSGTTNLGLLLGLPGPLSLAPLLALWAWIGTGVARSEFTRDGDAG